MSQLSILHLLFIHFFQYGIITSDLNVGGSLKFIMASTSHIALSGDMMISILGSIPNSLIIDETNNQSSNYNTKEKEFFSNNSFVLRILFLKGLTPESIGNIPVNILSRSDVNVSVIVPCSVFSRGGTYMFQLQYQRSIQVNESRNELSTPKEILISSALDVEWPEPSLNIEHRPNITYPDKSILITVKYNGISCLPAKNITYTSHRLKLIYCGSTVHYCDYKANNSLRVLHNEELQWFPRHKIVILQCQLFGQAGIYMIDLRSIDPTIRSSFITEYLKLDWSNEFTLDVRSASTHRCEKTGGINVLFEYPSCRLSGDRIRVYGRLSADVASFAPPSELHYVTELKAPFGEHSLTFDCNLFTEKYIEYCFVYISQAITGAVTEVKANCIPTFPYQENIRGNWGPWSSWTGCSSSCPGGTRNRYRFCDKPSPTYGVKFCEGDAIQIEPCEGARETYQESLNISNPKCPESGRSISQENGGFQENVHCRCGCFINFNNESTKEILSTNTELCPGHLFWVLQAKSNFVMKLDLERAEFFCPGQYLRIYDGDSLNSELLLEIAFSETNVPGKAIFSTNQSLLMEFSSIDKPCLGGFSVVAVMCHKKFTMPESLTNETFESNTVGFNDEPIFRLSVQSTPLMLFTLILLITIFLIFHYAYRYIKYDIEEDPDNFIPGDKNIENQEGISKRTLSAATLISEVISFVQFHSHRTDSSELEELKPRLESADEKPLLHTVISPPESPIDEKTPDDIESNSTLEKRQYEEISDKSTPSPDRDKDLNTTDSNNGKESKNRKNLEKFLETAASKSSLSNQDTDLELDYYDYDVTNASAAPGSYLGMDPAFFVWMPPSPIESPSHSEN